MTKEVRNRLHIAYTWLGKSEALFKELLDVLRMVYPAHYAYYPINLAERTAKMLGLEFSQACFWRLAHIGFEQESGLEMIRNAGSAILKVSDTSWNSP